MKHSYSAQAAQLRLLMTHSVAWESTDASWQLVTHLNSAKCVMGSSGSVGAFLESAPTCATLAYV